MGKFIDSIKSSIQRQIDRKKEEQEYMRKLRMEAQAQERLEFEKEFKSNALLVAKAKAKKDAAKMSGLQKLRAMNRSRRLTEGGNSGSYLSKLSDYTQRNIKNREENMKRTEEMQKAAKQIRDERMAEQIKLREERMERAKLNKLNRGGKL